MAFENLTRRFGFGVTEKSLGTKEYPDSSYIARDSVKSGITEASTERWESAKQHAQVGEIVSIEYSGWEEGSEEIDWPYDREDLELDDMEDFMTNQDVVNLLEELDPSEKALEVQKADYGDEVEVEVYAADREDIDFNKPSRRSRARGRTMGVRNIPFGDEPVLSFRYRE